MAKNNRTITLDKNELDELDKKIVFFNDSKDIDSFENSTICGDMFNIIPKLPTSSIDLLFVDPPYNLTKKFNQNTFRQLSLDDYEEWLDSWVKPIVQLLKKDASIYICGDWRTSPSLFKIMSKYFIIRNRITFEREKGRGAKTNWKNNSEDIWFATLSDKYKFNVDDVKQRRVVLAPYTNGGKPKDWFETSANRFRDTCPSNLWTDITIPFWSMPENTEHPTQKPEKLLAKIILASSDQGDLILDPFAGSGTTGVVAKKLNRQYILIEKDVKYCRLAQKRLNIAEQTDGIQGYSDNVFWDRNTLRFQKG